MNNETKENIIVLELFYELYLGLKRKYDETKSERVLNDINVVLDLIKKRISPKVFEILVDSGFDFTIFKKDEN